MIIYKNDDDEPTCPPTSDDIPPYDPDDYPYGDRDGSNDL